MQFTRDQTYRMFLFLYIPFAIHYSLRHWQKLFISHLVRAKFRFYRFSVFMFIISMEISIALKSFKSFPMTVKNLTENTWYGIEKMCIETY